MMLTLADLGSNQGCLCKPVWEMTSSVSSSLAEKGKKNKTEGSRAPYKSERTDILKKTASVGNAKFYYKSFAGQMDFSKTFFTVKEIQKESLLRSGTVVNIQMFMAF